VCGVFAIFYLLMFVTQPMWGQSLNDKALIAILTPLMIFLPTIIDKIIGKKAQQREAAVAAAKAEASPAVTQTVVVQQEDDDVRPAS